MTRTAQRAVALAVALRCGVRVRACESLGGFAEVARAAGGGGGGGCGWVGGFGGGGGAGGGGGCRRTSGPARARGLDKVRCAEDARVPARCARAGRGAR